MIDSGFGGQGDSTQPAPEMLLPENQLDSADSSTELAVTQLANAAVPVPFELLMGQMNAASLTAAGDGEGGRGTGDGGFFGVPLKDNSIVFVLDRSGSMQGGRIQRVQYELQSAINGLAPDQLFNVLLYNSGVAHALPVSLTGLLPASDTNRKKAIAAALTYPATGGTNGVLAIQEALKLRPEAIVFLTDGEFEINVESDVLDENPQRTKIHTVSIGDGTSLEILRRIARVSRGRFQHVQVERLQNPNGSPAISRVDRRNAARLLRLALGLERRRKFDRARDCCRKLLQEYPRLPEVRQAKEILKRIGSTGNGLSNASASRRKLSTAP